MRKCVRALHLPSCGLEIAGTPFFNFAETGDRMGLITAEEAARPKTDVF